MNNQFFLDIETMDIFESAVVLSIGVLAVDFEKDFDFNELVKNGCFIKLDAKDQVQRLGRSVGADTLSWWAKQQQSVREESIIPSPNDCKLEDGLHMLTRFLAARDFKKYKSTIWIRGGIDFYVLQHAYYQCKMEMPFFHSDFREVRTAIDLLAGTDNGYCKCSKPAAGLRKHNPVHDSAYDALLLKYYIEEGR